MTVIKRTQAELIELLRSRFGDKPLDWAFVCPMCGDVATARDFVDAGGRASLIGRECIGRSLGALKEERQEDWTGRGCDWVAYGLFQGPEFVIMPDGREVASFRPAEVPREAA